MASIQTSRSTPPDCHSNSAKAAASWVLPDDLSQSCASGAATGPGAGAGARSGTSATAAPAGSSAARPGAVSSRALKPSASAGTVPDRIGTKGHHNRNRPRRLVGRNDRWRSRRDNNIHLQLNQLSGQGRQPFELAFPPANLELKVFPFHIAQFV